MGCMAYARASDDTSYQDLAMDMFTNVLRYARDPSLVGAEVLPGQPQAGPLNIPMIVLNVIDEIRSLMKPSANQTQVGVYTWFL